MNHQTLPNVLQKSGGELLTSPKEWEEHRESLLFLLSREEYGFLPSAPDGLSFRLVEKRENYCASNAVFEKWEAAVKVGEQEFSFPFFAVVPTQVKKPMAFLHINFRNNVPDAYMPTEEIIDGGFAVFSFGYEDVTRDNDDFSDGLAALFPRSSGEKTLPGKISIWAWAAIRVMDHIVSRKDIDTANVAVIGHSRLGKTALWAGANDPRFSFVISNDSGCSGAAVSRGKQGEQIRDVTTTFPYWFCETYRSYQGKEEELPFDQHFLLSLIAPRKLYVSSAQEDLWADPVSELRACKEASPVYELYGISGLLCPEDAPAANAVFPEGNIGYHIRKGTHYLSRYDWQQFMAFLRRHRN